MIVILNDTVTKEEAASLAEQVSAAYLVHEGKQLLVTSAKVKELPTVLEEKTTRVIPTATDIQLASKEYLAQTRTVDFGGFSVGGDTQNTLVITGPCSVESLEQIESAAQLCVELGVKVLRAGAFKPRTSPYTFQGMGLEGLKLLAQMRDKYGLKIITEVRDSTHVDAILEYSDIVQIGAKSMYDHGILKSCGRSNKPVLLKRGFGTTLQEFVQSAEFILSNGNPNVLLCERGIRTFETKTRFTLDLCGVAWLKEYTNLPIVLDPSHAIGYAYGVADLSRACVAMGIDGLLIESHPNPKEAKSDAEQQLNFDEFKTLYKSLTGVANAIGKKII